ncbi:MAG: hypothetical protein P8Y68_03200 [Anaerolineales bacterium]|jgi:hypothetical protein
MMLPIFVLLFGVFGCAANGDDLFPDQPEPTDDLGDDGSTRRLDIDLQSGFLADTVQIEVNGELVWEEKEVTTEMLIGLADSIETEVSEGTVTLTVRIPTQDLSSEIDLDVDGDKYIGVSVMDGSIDIFVSDTPFGYG